MSTSPPSYKSLDETKNAENPQEETGFTIDQAIERIGLGWAQIKLFLMAGIIWISDGMEIMLISILGQQLKVEWYISNLQIAFITTIVFIGVCIGSVIFGKISDNYGRQKALLLSMSWTTFYALICALSPNYIWLLIIRLLLGIGVGGGMQLMTYYSEFLPARHRGTFVILGQLYWSVGAILAVGLAALFMKYGWRYWLAASGLPAAIFLLFVPYLPESPFFELAAGRPLMARAILERLATENGTSLPKGKLQPNPVEERANFKELIVPKYRRISLQICLSWFCAGFLYYGIALFSTAFIQAGTTCFSDAQLDAYNAVHHCSLAEQPLTDQDYIELTWTTAAEFPSIIIAALLIDVVGRRLLGGISQIIGAISCAVLILCVQRITMLVFLFIARGAMLSSFQILFIYTPELYPTHVRAVATGIGNACARVGAMITPYFAQVLMSYSSTTGLAFFVACGVVAAITYLAMPVETAGKKLGKIS